MKIFKEKIKKMSFEEIKKFVSENGSVFVSDMDEKRMIVQHLYIGDDKIFSLEFSPNEQFEQISKNVWFRQYVLPKVDNMCYWLYKNCLDFPDEEIFEKERDELFIDDDYSKNVLLFSDKNGEVSSKQTYILPVKREVSSKKFHSETIKFYSETLKEYREIVVVYPKSYEKGKSYKVLILTDGEPWFYTMHLEQTISQSAKNGDIDDYILCFIMQKDRNVELPMNKIFCKFICEDLYVFLKNKFNIDNAKDNFVFCGQSFGGLTALYIEMYFPNVFGKIICQSASLWYDKKDEILKHFAKKEIVSNLYYSYGNCEKSFIADKGICFKDFLKNLPKCKFNIFGGGHDYLSWEKDLLGALKFFHENN